jgi:hypothetical protein
MTNRDAGLLTFRALSIFALLRGLEQTERIVRAWPRTWPEQVRLLWQLIIYSQLFAPMMLIIIFSLILWKIAPRLSNRMFTNAQNTNDSAVALKDIEALVFSGIGLYLLVDTIPNLVQTFYATYASSFSQLDVSTQMQVNILRLGTILKLAVGFWLLLGAKGLSNIVSKIRNA